MTGFQRSFSLGLMLAPGSLNMYGVETLPDCTSRSGLVEVVLLDRLLARSIPVQNAFSPAPVRTTARTSSFVRNEARRACSSSCIA